MTIVHMYAYKNATEGGKAFCVHTQRNNVLGGVRLIKHEGSKYKGSKNKVVINWGSSALPDFIYPSRVINKPEAVAKASNKLTFFQESIGDNGPRIPDWTTDKDQAAQWVAAKDSSGVFARTVLRGNSGQGIVDVRTLEDLEPIPNGTLFVKYVPKVQEWRIHVDRTGNPFIIQRKARRLERENSLEPLTPNWRIRNLKNGFIFERNFDTEPHPDVVEQARRAVAKLELDFGAVDVIWNERRQAAYVLEVNTAPGIEGTSIEDYVNMIQRLLEN